MTFDPPFSKPRVRFLIDVEGVDERVYLGAADQLLFKVRSICRTAGAPVFAMSRELPGGIVVTAARVGTQDVVSVTPVSTLKRQPSVKRSPFSVASFRAIPASHTYPGGRTLVAGDETSFDTSGEWENYPNLRPPLSLSLWKFKDEQPGSVTWWSPGITLNGGAIVLSWRGPSGRYGRFLDPTSVSQNREDGATTIFGPNFVYTGRRDYPGGGWADTYFNASYNPTYRAARVWLNGQAMAVTGIAGDGVVESAALQRRTNQQTGSDELFLRVYSGLKVYEGRIFASPPSAADFFRLLPTTLALSQVASLGQLVLQQCPFFNESATRLAYMTSGGFFTFDIPSQASTHHDIEGSVYQTNPQMTGPTVSPPTYSYSYSDTVYERNVYPLAVDFSGDTLVFAVTKYERNTISSGEGWGTTSPNGQAVNSGNISSTTQESTTTTVSVSGMGPIPIGSSSATNTVSRQMVINQTETGLSTGSGTSSGTSDPAGTLTMLYGDLRTRTFALLHLPNDVTTASSSGIVVGTPKSSSVTGSKAVVVDVFVRGVKRDRVKAEWSANSSSAGVVSESEWNSNIIDWNQQLSVSPTSPENNDRGQLAPKTWLPPNAVLGTLYCPVSALYMASSPPGIPDRFDYVGLNIDVQPNASNYAANFSSFYKNTSPLVTPNYGVGDRQLLAEPLFMGFTASGETEYPV